MITLANVFKSNLFNSVSLTDAVNEIPYVPTRLGELDIFEVDGMPTTTAFIERKGHTLQIVQTTPRGGPGQTITIDRRDAIPFIASHLQVEDRLYADELLGVRGFGQDASQLVGVEEVRDERLNTMSQAIDLTLEYHRLGAIQGLVLDKDASVIDDLFDKFGIAEPADVDMSLDTVWNPQTSAVLKPKITAVLREIDDVLGGLKPRGYLALAGDEFFDALESHAELRDTIDAQNRSSLREDGRRTFTYAGVTWENYRGFGPVSIPDDEARIIPLGVPKLFRQLFAPADTMDAVNTMGKVKYSFAGLDPSGKNKFIDLEVQSNPLTYCTRPAVLRRLVA